LLTGEAPPRHRIYHRESDPREEKRETPRKGRRGSAAPRAEAGDFNKFKHEGKGGQSGKKKRLMHILRDKRRGEGNLNRKGKRRKGLGSKKY